MSKKKNTAEQAQEEPKANLEFVEHYRGVYRDRFKTDHEGAKLRTVEIRQYLKKYGLSKKETVDALSKQEGLKLAMKDLGI